MERPALEGRLCLVLHCVSERPLVWGTSCGVSLRQSLADSSHILAISNSSITCLRPRSLVELGLFPRMRVVRFGADSWQLSQRLHQPHSARFVDRLACFPLPALSGIDSLARQLSRAQLARPARPMPRLWTKHLSPLSGGRAPDRSLVCGLRRMFRIHLADV